MALKDVPIILYNKKAPQGAFLLVLIFVRCLRDANEADCLGGTSFDVFITANTEKNSRSRDAFDPFTFVVVDDGGGCFHENYIISYLLYFVNIFAIS